MTIDPNWTWGDEEPGYAEKQERLRVERAAERESRIATGVPYATDEGIRMRGRANLGGGYFDVPLIQKVLDYPPRDNPVDIGELWQGGCIGGLRLPEDFDFVLSLYPWERYTLGPDTERMEVTMYDSLGQATDQAQELAEMIADRVAGPERQKVLVHCQAGLNRSGLITALTLIKLGKTPDEAIDLLRKQRCSEVLCNITFEEYVRSQA